MSRQDADVRPNGLHLESDRFCEPAAQALQAIGGEPAQEALRAAQAKAAGDRKRTLDQAAECVAQ